MKRQLDSSKNTSESVGLRSMNTTFTVQKLYGALPEVRNRYLGVESMHLMPSSEMLGELSKLKHGTKVAVYSYAPRTIEKLAGLRVEGVTSEVDPEYTPYWHKVAAQCKESGLKLIYLLDASMHKGIVGLMVKSAELQKQYFSNAVMLGEAAPQNADYLEFQRLRREMYAVDIEIQYREQIKNFHDTLEKIEKARPDILILARGHAEMLWHKYKKGELTNFRIGTYAAEDVGLVVRSAIMDIIREEAGLTAADEDDTEPASNALIQNPELDQDILNAPYLTERRHRIITTGRLGEGKPDYVGTWHTELPMDGYFEMKIEDRVPLNLKGLAEIFRADMSDPETSKKIMTYQGKIFEIYGTIEDIAGKSYFEGSLVEGEGITFRKVYSEDAVRAGGFDGGIIYRGKGVGKSIQGTFTFEGDSKEFQFEMRPAQNQ